MSLGCLCWVFKKKKTGRLYGVGLGFVLIKDLGRIGVWVEECVDYIIYIYMFFAYSYMPIFRHSLCIHTQAFILDIPSSEMESFFEGPAFRCLVCISQKGGNSIWAQYRYIYIYILPTCQRAYIGENIDLGNCPPIYKSPKIDIRHQVLIKIYKSGEYFNGLLTAATAATENIYIYIVHDIPSNEGRTQQRPTFQASLAHLWLEQIIRGEGWRVCIQTVRQTYQGSTSSGSMWHLGFFLV